MSFDEQEDPLSDCLEHSAKMAKEIKTLKSTLSERDATIAEYSAGWEKMRGALIRVRNWLDSGYSPEV